MAIYEKRDKLLYQILKDSLAIRKMPKSIVPLDIYNYVVAISQIVLGIQSTNRKAKENIGEGE